MGGPSPVPFLFIGKMRPSRRRLGVLSNLRHAGALSKGHVCLPEYRTTGCSSAISSASVTQHRQLSGGLRTMDRCRLRTICAVQQIHLECFAVCITSSLLGQTVMQSRRRNDAVLWMTRIYPLVSNGR